ncbi:hypothetical protein Ahia01_000906400, partial [Argonauta hians]
GAGEGEDDKEQDERWRLSSTQPGPFGLGVDPTSPDASICPLDGDRDGGFGGPSPAVPPPTTPADTPQSPSPTGLGVTLTPDVSRESLRQWETAKEGERVGETERGGERERLGETERE